MKKLAVAVACMATVFPCMVLAADGIPAELTGKWLAEDIGGGGVVDGLQTTLEIHEDASYGGFAGCNRFRGQVTVEGDKITFGPAASTRMMCEPAAMDQETKLFKALEEGTSWRIDDMQKLVIENDGGSVLHLARFSEVTNITIPVPGEVAVERQSVAYACGDRQVTAEYVNAGPVSLALLSFDDEFVVASNVLSASGARYAGGQYVWWTKGDDATFHDLTAGEDAPGVECKPAS